MGTTTKLKKIAKKEGKARKTRIAGFTKIKEEVRKKGNHFESYTVVSYYDPSSRQEGIITLKKTC